MNDQHTELEDPMDHYSRPIKKVENKFGTLFYIEPRLNPNKPGRELLVNFDSRFPLVNGFDLNYSYYVRFFEKGNAAGNHYHHKKQELFIPMQGDFTVFLEDTQTKEQFSLELKSSEHHVFYISTKIAHKVVAQEAGNILLVMATSPNNDQDEFKYQIDER